MPEVDFVDRQAIQFAQTHFMVAVAGQGFEATFRQTALQRHLAALEADLVEATCTGFLALVAATGGFAKTRAHATASTLAFLPGALARL